MRRILLAVVFMLLCGAAVAQQATSVPRPADLQEVRISNPSLAPLEWNKLNMLAGRLFAQPWLQKVVPVWGPLPYPSKITQTYGAIPSGESLLDIDEAHGIWRPGWTWWKDEVSGVHAEKCEAGNWIVSTFVKKVVQTVTGPSPAPQPQSANINVNAQATFRASVNVYCAQPRQDNFWPLTPTAGNREVPPGMGVQYGYTVTLEKPLVGVGVWWHEEHIHQPQPPPPSPYCPPGVAPTPPPPPAAGGTTDPPPTGSGGGNPGPNIPLDRPDHGVITPPSGAAPPSAPWIADL